METLNLTQIIKVAEQVRSYQIHKPALNNLMAHMDKADPIYDDMSSCIDNFEKLLANFEAFVSPTVAHHAKELLAHSDQLGQKLNNTLSTGLLPRTIN